MPEGVNLTEVVQQGDRIELQGVAQSSTRVSALMRNIDDSDWLREPGLDVVEAVTSGVDRNAQFKVFAQQVSMATPEGEAAGGGSAMSIVDELRTLDTNDPGRWPLPIRVGAVAIVFVGRRRPSASTCS